MTPLRDYYDQRAPVYEAIYERDDPARNAELISMAEELRVRFRDRDVLEVACGTGYWTSRYADVTRRVVGVDAAQGMLDEARRKSLPPQVTLVLGDAYALEAATADAGHPGPFDAGTAMFWLSHVPRDRVRTFLEGFHARLAPGSPVFLADNLFVHGCGGQLVHRPGASDTFKRRELPDGSVHDVLKNYYAPDEIRSFLPGVAGLEVRVMRCFYTVRYRVA
jgi:SAM-dependent methyltransferase